MTVGEYKDVENEKFFIHLAEQSGQKHRYDYSWCYQGYGCKVKPVEDSPYEWIVKFDEEGQKLDSLSSAKILLEEMTDLYPPGKGERGEMRHNLTLNNGKLELTLMFDDKFQPVLITEDDLMEPVNVIINKIASLIDSI